MGEGDGFVVAYERMGYVLRLSSQEGEKAQREGCRRLSATTVSRGMFRGYVQMPFGLIKIEFPLG